MGSPLPPCSYAYRPGTGAQAGIDGILASAPRFASPVALRFDIRDFFNSIPRSAIAEVLHSTPCDHVLTNLVLRSLSAPVASPLGPMPTTMGIPQGSPLSPLLSNAVLIPFDQVMSTNIGQFFRYADDILILCRDEITAGSFLQYASDALSSIRLSINPTKTSIQPFGDCSFLGFGFTHRKEGWVRDLHVNTREGCISHLRRMEDSGKSPPEMAVFLRQWTAYFLPYADDRARHAAFLSETASTFRLVLPGATRTRQQRPPPGYTYDAKTPECSYRRFPWILRYFLRRVRFGLHFRRKGFIPIPSGFHITIAGHRIHLRF
ncbi:MAG: group II intron reverse transcriptase domain-containing protein [Akkermansiaceae bacterium]|nr:group II intron reverse transcriptase domain-containing protein [Akkermansiaceae bacterium]